MKQKIIDFGNNKSVDIYDDLFTFAERYHFENFVRNSMFRSGGSDGAEYANLANQIYSNFNQLIIE